MTELPQRSAGEEAQRGGAGLLASGLVHGLLLLAIVLLGSPHLFATVPPEAIVVEIVRPEELAKGKQLEAVDAKQDQAQNQQVAQKEGQPQKQQARPQQRAQTQSQLPVSAPAPAAPMFASLYPWPVTQPGSDV